MSDKVCKFFVSVNKISYGYEISLNFKLYSPNVEAFLLIELRK